MAVRLRQGGALKVLTAPFLRSCQNPQSLFKMLLRGCLWANLAIVSAFAPICLRSNDGLSGRSIRQKIAESTRLIHHSRRVQKGFFACDGGARDPQNFEFGPGGAVQHAHAPAYHIPAASSWGISSRVPTRQTHSFPAILRSMLTILSRSICCMAAFVIFGCLLPGIGLQSESASKHSWLNHPFVGSATALTAASESSHASTDRHRAEGESGSNSAEEDTCPRAIIYGGDFTLRDTKAAAGLSSPLSTADAESQQAGRGTQKLGDQPLWNGRWEGRRGGEGAEDKEGDERGALVMEAWELVRNEYLYQDKLHAMHLPTSGPLSQLAREHMQCFDKGVTWDAIGEAVKAHRFASDAESHNVIRGMLHMLDDRYAVFYSARQLSDLVDGIDPPATEVSSPAGVGLVLRGGWMTSVEVEDDADGHPTPRVVPRRVFKIRRVAMESPALRAGLREGDSILSIDGEPSATIPSLSLAQSLFKGRKGERLEVEVVRGGGRAGRGLRGGPGEDTLWESLKGRQGDGERGAEERVVVRRAELPTEQAAWGMMIEGARDQTENGETTRVGYINLHDFNTRTITEFRRILRNFQKSHCPPNLYVIDLRNNMGGLLSSGIGLCEELLPKGKGIVQLVGGHGPVDSHSVLSSSSSLPAGVPLIVLVNEGTASSSELVAAAVKDARRGLLVGKRTFGKGTVQAIVRMRDQSAVQLTIGRFKSPNDSLIPHKGIEPHVHADLPPEEEAVGRVLAEHFRSGAAVERALAAAS